MEEQMCQKQQHLTHLVHFRSVTEFGTTKKKYNGWPACMQPNIANG